MFFATAALIQSRISMLIETSNGIFSEYKVLVPQYYLKISSDPKEPIMLTFFVVVSCSLKYRLNFEFIPFVGKKKSLMSEDGEQIDRYLWKLQCF